MSSDRRDRPLGSFDACPCSGGSLGRLLQPAVMTVLAGGRLHGYAIVEQLAGMPMLAGSRPDPTGVYRVLRTMEERGFVRASWDTPERGPAKKVYELTSSGRKCLARWISSLAKYHRSIGELLATARKASVRLKRIRRRERE